MDNRTRGTVAGILAWATFGAVNGAIVGAMVAHLIGVAGPPLTALWIGAATGAAIGIGASILRAKRRP